MLFCSHHIRFPARVALVAVLTSACTVAKHPKLSAADIEHEQAIQADDKIEYAVLLAGGTVTFDENGATYAADRRVVHGILASGENVEIPISEIEYVGVRRESSGRPLLGAVLAAGIIVAMFLRYKGNLETED